HHGALGGALQEFEHGTFSPVSVSPHPGTGGGIEYKYHFTFGNLTSQDKHRHSFAPRLPKRARFAHIAFWGRMWYTGNNLALPAGQGGTPHENALQTDRRLGLAGRRAGADRRAAECA